MTADVVTTLEHALELARSGKMDECVMVGTLPAEDVTIGGVDGNLSPIRVMSLIGELEYQKSLLLDKLER